MLEGLLRTAQQARVPGVSAGVVCGGRVIWSQAVGTADGERRASTDDQYQIGSIAKTLIAASVLKLRDAGRIDLDDRVSDHVPLNGLRTLTIRQLLTHTSGIQREPPGNVWETGRSPIWPELLGRLNEVECVLGPGQRWHYSNLGFQLLGGLIEEAADTTCQAYVTEHMCRPLGMARTAWSQGEPAARGFLVDPYDDTLHQQPAVACAGTAGVGCLWSTVEDLLRWGALLCDPEPTVLSADSVTEMLTPHVLVDLESWTVAWGLGVKLMRRGERVFAGHSGEMPGFRAGLLVHPRTGVGAAVLINATAGFDPSDLALRLVETTLDSVPQPTAPWKPGTPAPERISSLLGRWWSEGEEFLFTYRDHALRACRVERPDDTAVFASVGDDAYRCVYGRELGEVLRVKRDSTGAAYKLYWATYPFTRDPVARVLA